MTSTLTTEHSLVSWDKNSMSHKLLPVISGQWTPHSCQAVSFKLDLFWFPVVTYLYFHWVFRMTVLGVKQFQAQSADVLVLVLVCTNRKVRKALQHSRGIIQGERYRNLGRSFLSHLWAKTHCRPTGLHKTRRKSCAGCYHSKRTATLTITTL